MSSDATRGPTRMHRFRATLQLDGKTATGIVVPADVVEALGGGRQPLVHVSLGDYTYRSKVAVRDGVHKLPVSAEHRAGAGIAAGDEVEVGLAVDTDPREVEVPADLAAALAAEPAAHAAFQQLSPSRQRAITLSVEGAKSADTRARRVATALATLLAP